MNRHPVFLSVVLMTLVGGPPLAAAPAPRIEPKVVVLSAASCCAAQAWPQAEGATVNELRAMGITVVVRPSRAKDERTRRQELSQVARAERAFCALRILRGQGGAGSEVDLSLTDRLTRKTLWRTLRVDPKKAGAASLVALRVVELLRASLLELQLRRRPHRPSVPRALDRLVPRTGPPSLPPVVTRPRRWALRFALGAIGGPGGAGAHGDVALAVRWTVLPQLDLELASTVTGVGEDVASGGLSASVDLGTAALWAHWVLLTRGRLRPAVGLGAGVLWLWSTGQTSGVARARTDAAAAAYVAVRADLGLVLTPWLWLRLGVTAGVALPEIEIRFLGTPVARLGLPVLAGRLGLEVRL